MCEKHSNFDNTGVTRKSVPDGQYCRQLREADQLLFTVGEVSQILSLSRSTIYELLYAKSLPSVKIGGARRVRRDDLESFVRDLTGAS